MLTIIGFFLIPISIIGGIASLMCAFMEPNRAKRFWARTLRYGTFLKDEYGNEWYVVNEGKGGLVLLEPHKDFPEVKETSWEDLEKRFGNQYSISEKKLEFEAQLELRR